ncbi:MAG: RNA 3'-terminal phosphate cyclase [Nitrosopumilus sp.]|uniref:RNA 3'-terminal phosphate cyclase n=1 Tax=Nitrosopumilus sp. TaxID=2024843 RepID=UPI00246FC55B|nr:RNA 3'-terminal phosphate cyclase [Nitrosopumilus sp.]MDH5430636.1 RNA 3'-terminal phosphate cyclase [Nitrosopumilus sp.]MDH5664990.1 RNA 3'-terminal phosphate cyclase [Nitrosopumilus sp.]MDH5696971.1 RNA 3'-terminal phosphate cyclase [Nitrosopumilus sp.]
MNFLKINGAYGEGGGQIIRSAISLSCITKQPIHIENIRKNRKISGLKPQHLTAITLLQKIVNAKVIGADVGSTELKFIPGNIENLDLQADVGTAGSIPLILQVLIPVVAVSKKKLNLKIKGGTDVLWSPTIDYTQYVLRDAYSRMGIKFSFELCKRGYYPKGGGKINLQINPSNVKPILFSKRKTNNVKLICTYSKLIREEIENGVKEIVKKLTAANFIVDVEIKSEEALDLGASLLIYSTDDKSIIGLDGLYNNKIHNFDLNIEKFIESYSIDDNLADMIVVPASLANGKTIFQVREITKHLETNLFVTSKITGCKYGIGKTSYGYDVIIEGISDSSIKQ